jgi:hypothetical protein
MEMWGMVTRTFAIPSPEDFPYPVHVLEEVVEIRWVPIKYFRGFYSNSSL